MKTVNFLLFSWLYLSAFGQLTLIVEQIPLNTPPNADIFVAGNFNNWHPGNPLFKLSRDEKRYLTDLNIAAGNIQFKFTRGSWTSVEGSGNGSYIPNRNYQYSGAKDTLRLSILGWEDLGGSQPSTATSSVSIITDSFYMPEFSNYRRIWLYLPPDYNDRPEKKYPVLYMHDGQNLFDRNTSFAGEWRVDESLDSLYQTGFNVGIVVGIENGGSHRLAEYTPWPHPTYGGGEGDRYIQFIRNTLKPYIDNNYRTLPEGKHTGIMGSSLGGLISMYAGLQYPEDFTKVGALSPSFWFSSKIYDLADSAEHLNDSRFYLIAGTQEGGNQVSDMIAMVNILQEKSLGYSQLFHETHQGATHSEWYWAREFPKAYQFLFSELSSTENIKETANEFFYRQSPGKVIIEQASQYVDEVYNLSVFDSIGRLVTRYTFTNLIEVNTKSWNQGIYWFQLGNKSGICKIFKIIISE